MVYGIFSVEYPLSSYFVQLFVQKVKAAAIEADMAVILLDGVQTLLSCSTIVICLTILSQKCFKGIQI